MKNSLREELKEKLLDKFLTDLDDYVFITSTNSVTGEEEILRPEVEDMEAIIKISGEWDREDLKNILLSLLTSHNTELLRKIEGMKMFNPEGDSKVVNMIHGYNQALDEVINIIKQEK